MGEISVWRGRTARALNLGETAISRRGDDEDALLRRGIVALNGRET